MISSTVYHRGFHLEQNQLSHRNGSCPLCGGLRFTPLFALQSDPEIFLMTCPDCGGSFADWIPSEKIFTGYEHYYEGKSSRTTFVSPSVFARRIFKELHLEKDRSIRILDFGGGDGALSLALARKIASVTHVEIRIIVVDICGEAMAVHEGKISMRGCLSLSSAGGLFDVVLASSVLEHLADPAAVLNRLFAKLAPGGFFYARHPYIVPVMKFLRVLGIRFDFTYPLHLCDFGGRFWRHVISLPEMEEYTLQFSRPSPVESSFKAAPVRTLIAYGMKALWHLTFGCWSLVGGWEAGIVKKSALSAERKTQEPRQ
jgi:SAM-dependent methyltransferase